MFEQTREELTAVLIHPGLRIAFVFPGIDDHVTKLEVVWLAGQPIEEGDGLKYAGGGHALVGTGKSHASLVYNEGFIHQVRSTHARLECWPMIGGAMVREQSDEVVLVRPDVPDWAVPSDPVSLTELVSLLVRAQIPIGELRIDKLPHGGIHARLEPIIPREPPRVGCRVQILSYMLPGPPLLPWSVDKWVENHIQIQLQQTFLDIDVHAVGNPALVPGAP